MHGDDRDGRLPQLLQRFGRAHDDLPAGDARRHFCGLYLRSTEAMSLELAGGGFADREWVTRLTVAFAGRYLDALEASLAGSTVPLPWRLAFEPRPGTSAMVHQMVGLNAHLNLDLPMALLDVLTDEELAEDAVLRLRHADFRHIDDVMVRRIPVEHRELLDTGGYGGADVAARLLYPLNLLASRRWLVTARRSVWRNALVLSRARRSGGAAALAGGAAQLETLCAAQVGELLRPGQLLLRLAVRGFGVDLAPDRRPVPVPPPAR